MLPLYIMYRKSAFKKFVHSLPLSLFLWFLFARSNKIWTTCKTIDCWMIDKQIDHNIEVGSSFRNPVSLWKLAENQFSDIMNKKSSSSSSYSNVYFNEDECDSKCDHHFMLPTVYTNKGKGVFSYFTFGLGSLIIMAIIAAMIIQWMF